MPNYKDANGYVFLDRTEAEPGWIEMTEEETASVLPMTRNGRRAWAKWHASREEDGDGAA